MRTKCLMLRAMVVFVIVVGAVAAKPYEAPAAGQVIEWRFAHTTPVPGTIWQAVGTEEFGKRLEKATNGRLKVTHIVGVINGLDGMTALREGRIQACNLIYAYIDATWPTTGLTELYGLARNEKDLEPLIDQVTWPIAEKEFRKAYGAKLVAQGCWAGRAFRTSKPFRTVDDFKGTKLRVDSKNASNNLKALGGSPVAMPFGELYTALQRNMVDGFISASPPVLGSKMYEVSKYINEWPIGLTVWGVFVQEKALNALPQDVRTAVEAELTKMRNEMITRDLDAAQKATETMVKKHGCIVIKPSDAEIEKFKQIAKSTAWEEWFKLTGDKGRQLIVESQKALGYK